MKVKVPNWVLGWAWGQIKPNVKKWLTERALVLPTAKKAKLADEIRQMLFMAGAKADNATVLAVIQHAQDTYTQAAADAVDTIVL